MPNRLAGAREPCRAVRQEPLVLLLTNRQAQIRPLVETVRALTALRREQGHDVIAGTNRRHSLAYLLDHTRALVAEHGRRVPRRIRTRCRVEIRVTHPARDEANEHLARLRLGEIDLLHLERRAELLEDRGVDPHPGDATQSRT
jgi:hypothetical protein